MKTGSSSYKSIAYLLLAIFIISLQNVAIKWISGDFPALEIVLFRSLVALPFTLVFFRLERKKGLPRTQRLHLELLRGVFLFLSYTTHMMGLASLQLDQVEAIRFSSPLMITILAITLLGEKLDLRRWIALIIGFCGVLLIINPGTAAFNLGSVFVLISVFFYALTVILTRKLQNTDSSATMAYYSAIVYLVFTLALAPLAASVGIGLHAHPSIAFLLDPWGVPGLLDLMVMAGLGMVWAGWMYYMSRAYSEAPATVIAPFEYASLPINILWGWVIFNDTPTWMTIIGAVIALGSGMFILDKNKRDT